MTEPKCTRCGCHGHTHVQCTPPPCPECEGVDSHITEACSVYQRMVR